jgi:formyl-CoA transferase
MSNALAGVRVLDIATLYPAPLLAAMLGDVGADVVKVEPPDGDPLRTFSDVAWSVAARNKRSVRLDFDDRDGLALLGRLIDVADVVVFNQPATVLERWHCTDGELQARNARLVIVHVTAFGMTGPYADRVGNGSLAEAFVGVRPTPGVPIGDTVGAMAGVIRVLLALRERDDRRQVVDLSLYESLLPLVATRHAGQTAMTRALLLAADGREVMVSATTGSQTQRLDELTGGGDLARWVREQAADDAVAALIEARVPAVVVNDHDQLRADPHVVARNSMRSAPPAPGLGDHTDEVVEEWLGDARA